MHVDYEILLRFLIAALWGGLVGAEREYRSKSAGFRTLMMISIGSCFFTIMSMVIGGAAGDRIASNIVTGIGFLGAGVIFRLENKVSGITTAATIWVVAAVGMGIGAGYYFASASASIMILFILAILPLVENKLSRYNLWRQYTIVCDLQELELGRVEELLRSQGLKFEVFSRAKAGDEITTIYNVRGDVRRHELFGQALLKERQFRRFSY